MTGRTIVITSASDGIGAAAARRLSRSGEHVVVIGRSKDKTKAVAAELGADCFVADVADVSQCGRWRRRCVRRIRASTCWPTTSAA